MRQIRGLNKDEYVYAVDGDSGFTEQSNVVLLKMGKYMEKMFTTDADYFNDHFVLDPQTNQPKKPLTPELLRLLNQEDYFRYMKSGKIFLRSQIDARGQDAEGNDIVFELKTRATAPLRYDIVNYIDFLDYHIVKLKGMHSSFEREYYDLIRGGFLKYIMQMKIGRMQGAAIAYHNTQKIFGFEYVPLEQMERRVFGCSEFSDVVFQTSLSLIEKILDFILADQHDEVRDNKQLSERVFKIGLYANEKERCLDIMCEVFENDDVYQERFKDYFSPNYMKDPIDFYLTHKIKPNVTKYQMGLYPILNGVFVD